MTQNYTVFEWETHPYTSYDKRSQTVQHRVQIKHYEKTAVDVVKEVREPAAGLKKWTEVEVWEVRQHGVTHVEKHEAEQ